MRSGWGSISRLGRIGFGSRGFGGGGFYVGRHFGGGGFGRNSGGGVTIGNVTKTFFRPELVRDPIERARQRVLSRFGMFVMRDARQALRRGKRHKKSGRRIRSVSPNSPKSWNDKKDSTHNDLLKRFIFYSYDPPNNVVIGPVKLEGPIAKRRIPKVLEYGGTVPNKDRHGNTIESRIAERPYMRPAFDRQVKKRMPMDFEGSIRN